MKTQTTLKPKSSILVLIAIGLLALMIMAPASRAGFAVPYAVDPSTLHLWHMTNANDVISLQTADSQSNNVQTTPMTLVLQPGQVAPPDGAGVTTQFPSSQPAEYSSLYSGIQFTQYACAYGPFTVVTNGDGTTNFLGGETGGCNPINTNVTDYANPTSGAFTWEAIICPGFNVITPPYITQLITGDSGLPTRSWQLRLTGGHLEYIDNISSGSKTYDGNIPTTGPDAAVPGGWYHIALAFSGTAPTNGDAPNVLTMYWSALNPAYTNTHVMATFTKTTMQTGLTFFCISGSGRASVWSNVGGGAGFEGIIQEVRISDINRKANEMAFTNNAASPGPMPPTFVLQPPGSTVAGEGQTLTLNAIAFSTPDSPAIQWSFNGAQLLGQTNVTLIITNMNSANAGVYMCSATNSVGGTNSTGCTVSLGAGIDGLFNSGVDANGNVLYTNTAIPGPGSLDPHYLLVQTPDPFAHIPTAIVWANAAPLSPNGPYAPENQNSGFIGPEEAGGQDAIAGPGTCDFQTSFLIDQGTPGSATITGSIIPAGMETVPATLQVLVNGNTATNITVNANPLTTAIPFTLTSASGLAQGSNTVDFIYTCGGSAAVGAQIVMSGVCANILPPGLPVLTNQPASQIVPYGSKVVVPIVALAQPPLGYQWYSNNVAIYSGAVAINPAKVPSAATRALTFVATNFSPSEVVGTNFTANYFVVVTNASGSVTSSVATVTIAITPVILASVGVPVWNATNNETNIIVTFSKTVNLLTATNLLNYSLNNGASVLSAALVSPNEVALGVSLLNPATAYMLTVQNVQDFLNVPIVPVTVPVGIYPTTALWIKATSGITTDSGGVNAWNDLSGNNNNLTQPNGSPFEPQLTTNALHGVSVQFTPANLTYMSAASSSSLVIGSNMSIVAVVDYAGLSGSTNGMIVSKTTGAIPASYDYYTTVSGIRLLRGNGSAAQTVTSTGVPGVNDPYLLDVVMNGTSVTDRINGASAGGGTLNVPLGDNGDSLYIGTRVDAGSFLNGSLSTLMVIPSALSSYDVPLLENYLAAFYNIPTGTNTYPAITQEPVSSTNLNAFGTLTVPTTASGVPAVAYQWYDTNSNAQVVGQTNATLVISNFSVSDGYYEIVTNTFGTVTSSIVAVTPITGLNVTLGPPSITTYIGSGPTLTAAAAGSLPFYYQWNQNGSPILGATNANYTAIATSGTVNYTCTVTNFSNGLLSTNAGPVSLVGISAPTNTYQSAVLGNHPLAFWQLTEGPDNGSGNGGVIANDYAGGHNAIYTNVILGAAGFSTLSSTDKAVIFGEYPSATPFRTNSFAGEIYNTGLAPVDFSQPAGNNGELSVEAWVVSSNSSPVGGSAIVSKGFGNGGEQFDLDLDPGFRFLVRDASGAVHGPTLATAPVVGQWNHVVGVFDGANGTVHLYVNGVDVADTTGFASGLGVLKENLSTPTLQQASYVSIGSRTSASTSTNFNFNLQGKVDDVALYNYALTPAQVQSDYLAGARNLVFNSSPTNITFVTSSNALALSWPVNHTGWQLQAQTNKVSVGISTNWVNVNNTVATNMVIVPINLTNGVVFYRLVFP